MTIFNSKLIRRNLVISAFVLLPLNGADAADMRIACDIDIASLRENRIANKKTGSWGHIFCGDINLRKGRATGYHHRVSGRDSAIARVGDISKINPETGVYEAAPVEVFHNGKWFYKKRGSSFFPDQCTRQQVVNSVLYAAENHICRFPNGKWGGMSAPSSQGNEENYCYGIDGQQLVVNGYFTKDPNHIATAWPVISNIMPSKCEAIN
ncbi:MAG: EndoU domain-containing protein [Alphaproteobacteria bacterium]|nr:EndoU domain-containing protein [Alphaproteobacteria bacterium]